MTTDEIMALSECKAAPAPCPVCHGEGIVLIGDGYSFDGCPACRPAAPAPDADEIMARITAYLSGGGLFNPELANHDAVRDLLIDCRAAIERVIAERDSHLADAEIHCEAANQWSERAVKAEAERDACHAELKAISAALGTIDGHSSVDNIKALKAERDALRALLVEALKARQSDIDLSISYLGQIYGLIEEGRLDDASELCRAAAQSWTQDIVELLARIDAALKP